MSTARQFLAIADPALELVVEVDTDALGTCVYISDVTDTVRVSPRHLAKLTAALIEAHQDIAGKTA